MSERILSVTPEYTQEVQSHGAWLGGYFEIGSTLRIEMKSAGRFRYPGPFMKIFDNWEAKVDRFNDIFGGTKHQKGNSWELSFGITQAAVLASSLVPYAPSKSAIAKLIGEWKQMTPEERIIQKASLDERERNESVKREDYRALLRNPDFVAGVLDNRAIILSREVRRPIMRLYSKNLSLLNALATRFGGNVETDTEAVEARSEFFGVDQSDFEWFGKRWIIKDEELEGVLNFTEGHHLLIPETFSEALHPIKNKPEFKLPPILRQDIRDIALHLATGLEQESIKPDGTFSTGDGVTLFAPALSDLWYEEPIVRITNPHDYSLAGLAIYHREDVERRLKPYPFKRIGSEGIRVVQEYKQNVRVGNVSHILIILQPTHAQTNSGIPYDERNFIVIRKSGHRIPANWRFIPRSLRFREVGLAST